MLLTIIIIILERQSYYSLIQIIILEDDMFPVMNLKWFDVRQTINNTDLSIYYYYHRKVQLVLSCSDNDFKRRPVSCNEFVWVERKFLKLISIIITDFKSQVLEIILLIGKTSQIRTKTPFYDHSSYFYFYSPKNITKRFSANTMGV